MSAAALGSCTSTAARAPRRASPRSCSASLGGRWTTPASSSSNCPNIVTGRNGASQSARQLRRPWYYLRGRDLLWAADSAAGSECCDARKIPGIFIDNSNHQKRSHQDGDKDQPPIAARFLRFGHSECAIGVPLLRQQRRAGRCSHGSAPSRRLCCPPTLAPLLIDNALRTSRPSNNCRRHMVSENLR